MTVTHCPPRAFTKGRVFSFMVHLRSRDVRQISIAYLWVLIPQEHWVDGFRELSTAWLINATGINPLDSISAFDQQACIIYDPYRVFPSVLLGLSTASGDFHPPRHIDPAFAFQVLKSDFALSPAMRKDSIEWDFRPEELMELKGCGVQKSHDSRRFPLIAASEYLQQQALKMER